MASIIKNGQEKSMADEDLPGDDDLEKKDESAGKDPEPLHYARKAPESKPGYFTIYKRGQGYWTRMGTVFGVLLIAAFTAFNIYQYVPTFVTTSHERGVKIGAVLAIVFLAGFAWLAWRLLNKPTNVDFLVATDSEMKKVNWTSRKELVGSTQIVIIFMFMVAMFLFAVDQVFWWLMYAIHVLKISPLG